MQTTETKGGKAYASDIGVKVKMLLKNMGVCLYFSGKIGYNKKEKRVVVGWSF